MTAPGWHPDPEGSGQQRYWDGRKWLPVPPKRRSSTRTSLIVVGAIFAVLAVLAVAGVVTNGGNDDNTSAAEQEPPKPVNLGTFDGNGTYHVRDGSMPDPGRWESAGGQAGGQCVWMRKTSERVAADNVIERGEAGPGERTRVELKEGEYFTTLWCEPWKWVGY